MAAYPELKDGFSDPLQVENIQPVVARLLTDIFPAALTLNEIKAVSIPYLGLTFNYTQRFLNILSDAGTSFDFSIRDFGEHQSYIMSCCIILNAYYGTDVDFSKPLFYDIPTSTGILKHYRILYNADFLEIIPTEKSIDLTKADIDFLIDNYDDLDLWKAKFPPNSWIVKGFGLMTLIDVTVENAVSTLKSNLLSKSDANTIQKGLGSIFRSIFKIPELHVGFTSFDAENDKFTVTTFGKKVRSYLLEDENECNCDNILLSKSYEELVREHKYITVSNVTELTVKKPESKLAKRFLAQGLQSFILAPVVKNGTLWAF